MPIPTFPEESILIRSLLFETKAKVLSAGLNNAAPAEGAEVLDVICNAPVTEALPDTTNFSFGLVVPRPKLPSFKSLILSELLVAKIISESSALWTITSPVVSPAIPT